MSPTYRRAREADFAAIYTFLDAAFAPSGYESGLVKLLWMNEKISAHYVAAIEDGIVGYLAYSVASGTDGLPLGLHLGPLAVAPAHQRKGIGAGLVEHSLEDLGTSVPLFVLGDPRFYARFGFTADPELRSEFEQHPGHFQVLARGALPPGEIGYEPEFREVSRQPTEAG